MGGQERQNMSVREKRLFVLQFKSFVDDSISQ